MPIMCRVCRQISSVVWNLGDGANQTVSGASISHTYANGGRYLVFVQVTGTYQSFLIPSTVTASNGLALFPLTVEPNLPPDQAPNLSIPTINFPSSTNPTALSLRLGMLCIRSEVSWSCLRILTGRFRHTLGILVMVTPRTYLSLMRLVSPHRTQRLAIQVQVFTRYP